MMAWLFYCHSCCFAIVFGHTVIGHKQKPRKRKKGGERKKEEGAFIDDKAKSPFGSYCFFFLVQSFKVFRPCLGSIPKGVKK